MSIWAPEVFSDELLAFAITCVFCGAISRDEFTTWCSEALILDAVPSYLYNLLEFNGALFKIYQVIGYVPRWDHSQRDEYALYGIAVLRGNTPYDMPTTSAEAVAHLKMSPGIESIFRKTFTFINL